MTQVLLTHVVPLTTSQDLATAALCAQMHAWLQVPAVVCQHASMYALVHAFAAAAEPSASTVSVSYTHLTLPTILLV